MTDPSPEPILDAELVALVHGELDPAAARTLRTRLTKDADAEARHAALAATDEALYETLATHAAPGRDAPSPKAQTDWWRPLLGIAAVLIVAAVFVFARRDADAAVGKNEFVELTVAPRGGASHPLFTEVALELRWKSLGTPTTWRYLSILSYGFGRTREAMAKSVYAIETAGKILPVVVSAELRAPDGTVIAARLRPAGRPDLVDFHAGEVTQMVTLRDFEVQTAQPRPYLGGRPGEGGWVEDFLWSYQQMPRDQTARWFPDQPGEWRIELRVESLPLPEPDAWPTFAEPLVVKTAVVLTADVSAWGVPHDGLRARLVFATGCRDVDRAPIALQIQNQSGRTRKYNVTGTTMAKIPQPFHFTLYKNSEGSAPQPATAPATAAPGTDVEAFYSWEQRPGIAVITASDDEMVPHADGTIRTLVVCADYWRSGGKRLSDFQGKQRIFVEFHFEPSVWLGNDNELWMGKINTGELTIDVPKRD